MTDLINKDTMMVKKSSDQIEFSDVLKWAKQNAIQISMMVTVFSFCSGAAWKLYAEEKLDDQIKLRIKPLQEEIVQIKKDQKEIIDNQKQQEFTSTQMLLIMQKLAGKKIVDQVKEETEQFRPKNTGEK